MTLDDAIAAVEASLESAHLRVDRKRAREDPASHLLVVLDISGGRGDEGPVANGPTRGPLQGPAASSRVAGGRGSFL